MIFCNAEAVLSYTIIQKTAMSGSYKSGSAIDSNDVRVDVARKGKILGDEIFFIASACENVLLPQKFPVPLHILPFRLIYSPDKKFQTLSTLTRPICYYFYTFTQ